ncbi:MAG TPA: MFS transporter, partial [Bacteroidota bacterium]
MFTRDQLKTDEAALDGKPRGAIPRNVIALGIVSLFTDSATEMIYPLIPLFVATLGSGALILGVIEGVAETTAAWLKLATGIVSDRWRSRKGLVLAGYLVSTLARPFTGLVSAAWQIVFVRMIDRVGKGIRTAPRDALIAASVDRTIYGKAYGFHRAMDHTGAVVGPLAAIVTLLMLAYLGGIRDTALLLRWVFVLALVPGLLAVGTIILYVREQRPAAGARQEFRFSLRQFDRSFLTYLGAIFVFTLGNSSDAFMLFRVEEAVNGSGALRAFVLQLPALGGLVRLFGNPEAQQAFVDALFLPLVWA